MIEHVRCTDCGSIMPIADMKILGDGLLICPHCYKPGDRIAWTVFALPEKRRLAPISKPTPLGSGGTSR